IENLVYHGKLGIATRAMEVAWPKVEKSDDIVPWGIAEFIEQLIRYKILHHIEQFGPNSDLSPTIDAIKAITDNNVKIPLIQPHFKQIVEWDEHPFQEKEFYKAIISNAGLPKEIEGKSYQMLSDLSNRFIGYAYFTRG